ncbi:MAG: hypothetical protein IPK22_11590 [Verrucomicrobiaceae bacterium]|nr:hypothetical protein [Verrucomicrobiaceae bacterium]
MTKAAKEFLKSTMTKMDEILAALTQEEQHDLLDALAGEITEVDHILPVAKFPQYGKEFWNLELMPQSLNRRKSDTVGQRQLDLLRRVGL